MPRISFSKLHIKQLNQFQIFLKNYWRKEHIFVKNKKFLIWQHKDRSFLTYTVAKLKNKIVGVHGYIPQSHYDPQLPNNEIFSTIFRALDVYQALGFRLFRFIQNNLPTKFIGTSGFRHDTIDYQKRLGFTVGLMDHYLAVSPFFKKYKIMKYNKKIKTFIKSNNCKFFEVNEKFLKENKLYNLFKHQYPRKSNIFIINRYLKHPIYKYNVFLLKKNSKPSSILVLRKVNVGKTNAFRIVDFIGKQNEFSNIGNLIIYLFRKYKSEFIDIYSYGIDIKYMKKLGFKDRRKIRNLIVPDNYEPLIKKNANLMYGYISKYRKNSRIRILKGDGDRDRPTGYKC